MILRPSLPGATKAVIISTAALVGLKVGATGAVFAATYLRGSVLLSQVAMPRLRTASFVVATAALAPLRAMMAALAETLQIVALRFRLAAAAFEEGFIDALRRFRVVLGLPEVRGREREALALNPTLAPAEIEVRLRAAATTPASETGTVVPFRRPRSG